MSNQTIPEGLLQAVQFLLDSNGYLFKDAVKMEFKPFNSFNDEIGCYCSITLPSERTIAINSFNYHSGFIYHMVVFDVKDGKKHIPYLVDLNSVVSSIKAKHSNVYSNNLTFTFKDDVLSKIVLNQAVKPNGSDEVNYLLYCSSLHNKFKLNDNNSLSFYIFNFLMSNTRLSDVISDSDYLGQFEEFMKADKSYIELLKMYEI